MGCMISRMPNGSSPAILPNGNNWQFRFFKEA